MAFWNKRDLFRLFSVCAFPIHVWAIVLMLQQVSPTLEWTGPWTVVGLASYTLGFALFESAILTAVVILFAYLLPRTWQAAERLVQISLLFLVFSLWVIVRRLLMIFEISLVAWQLVGLILLILVSLFLPVVFLHRSGRFQSLLLAFIDKLVVLAALYVALDVAGVFVIIFRNLWGPL